MKIKCNYCYRELDVSELETDDGIWKCKDRDTCIKIEEKREIREEKESEEYT